MKKLLLVTFVISLFSTVNYGQPVAVWSKFFGGADGKAVSVKKTPDGGVILGGLAQAAAPEASQYHGLNDALVVKLDAQGELEWAQCYGTDQNEYLAQITPTADGGYAFAGMAVVGPGNSHFWVVKLDSQGNVVWDLKYGGSGSDRATSISELADGGFIVSGWGEGTWPQMPQSFGNTDYTVIRVNAQGEFVSGRKFGGIEADYCAHNVANPDGSYVLAGTSYSADNQVTCRTVSYCTHDMWVVKVSPSHEIVWSRCFTSVIPPANSGNMAEGVTRTSDGGYAIAGITQDYYDFSTSSAEVKLIKLDADGNTQWQHHYGGSNAENAYAVKQCLDGGFITVGSSDSNDGMVSVDLTGMYGAKNGVIFKTDSLGNLEWSKVLGSTGIFGIDVLYDIDQVSETEFITVGQCGSENNNNATGNNGRRFWVTKVSTANLSNEDILTTKTKIYPNPAQTKVYIQSQQTFTTSEVFDLSGRLVSKNSNSDVKEIDLTALPTGLYNVRLSNGMSSSNFKISKL